MTDTYLWDDRAAYEQFVQALVEEGASVEAAEAQAQALDLAEFGCTALFDPDEFDGV